MSKKTSAQFKPESSPLPMFGRSQGFSFGSNRFGASARPTFLFGQPKPAPKPIQKQKLTKKTSNLAREIELQNLVNHLNYHQDKILELESQLAVHRLRFAEYSMIVNKELNSQTKKRRKIQESDSEYESEE